MIDLAIPTIMIFLAGDLFGIGTTMIVDWYYQRKWRKEQEGNNDK